MSINPKQIIKNKAKTLTSNLSTAAIDAVSDVDLSQGFTDLKNATTNVYDASGAVNVLKDKFSKIDATGLTNTIGGFGNLTLPSLANLGAEINAIYPPGLNQFANGLGAALQGKKDKLVEQVIPMVDSIPLDIVDYAAQALDGAIETTVEEYAAKFADTVKGSDSSPEVEPKGPGISLKNPLRAFNSVNCIFTLGALTADSANNPSDTYLNNGADFTILRSGGGGIDDKRIQTAYDSAGDEKANLEYFIDDFEMDAVVTTNSKTGATQAINFSFTVKEPYSMGIFLQMLQSAAFDAGFENYLQCPYLLELDFVGFGESDKKLNEIKPMAFSNRKLPFKLTNIEFDVNNGGSTYQVSCIPWNEQSFDDDVQLIKEPVSLTGNDVVEILSVGEQSLSTVINSSLQKIAKDSCSTATDFYLVRFPSQRTGDYTTSYLRRPDILDAATTRAEARSSRKGAQTAAEDEVDSLTSFFKNIGADTTSSALLETLKSSSVKNLNQIGASPMISDYTEGGDNPFGLGLYAYDKDTHVYSRNGIELTISDTNRIFKFNQGTPITKIIEELVIVSEYGRSALKRTDEKGEVDWFRIESQCFVISDRQHESATGTMPKIYVYDVVPYKVDASRFSAPNQAGAGLIEKAKHCVKTYNYIYSGANEDVLGFDIKFNAAFFQAIQMDMGQLNASNLVNDREKTVVTPKRPSLGKPTAGNTIPEGTTRSTIQAGNFNGGSYNKQYGEEVAKMFHNALVNSKVDLITANLEIWGDPYFIPDSGIGNHTSPRGGSKNITAGGAMDHQRNEIDIIVNFRTPVDYNNDGTMFFPGATVAVDSFSGVYQVIKVTSTISGNQFKQTLELIRRRNQSTEGISKVKAVIEKPNCPGLNPKDQNPNDVAGSDAMEDTTNQNNEIIKPTGANGPLKTITTPSGKTTQVAAIVADKFQGLINELETDLGYEITTLGGYVQRNTDTGVPSYHASGLAIDINSKDNGMIRPRPEDAPEPTDMPGDGTGSLMSALASKYGLGWGGDWKSATDAMHFSAASSEGGSVDWQRNGQIPGGFVGPPEPPSAMSDGQAGATNDSVSGTKSTTQTAQTTQADTTLRPYFPLDPADNLYDVQKGNKIAAIASFYTAKGKETSSPVTQTASGVTYNEFGDPVNTKPSQAAEQFDPNATGAQ